MSTFHFAIIQSMLLLSLLLLLLFAYSSSLRSLVFIILKMFTCSHQRLVDVNLTSILPKHVLYSLLFGIQISLERFNFLVLLLFDIVNCCCGVN